MQLKAIKIGELNDFIESDLFRQSRVIPITTIRAYSQINNPRADVNDICLIVSISDSDQIIGYIGILPDRLFNDQKAGWLSCWWVDNDKGKKVGMHLFLLAIKAWDHKFIITDFTPQIKEIIQKSRLFKFTPTQYGIRGFLRFNSHKILPDKHKLFQNIKSILKLGDSIANIINDLRIKSVSSKYNAKEIRIEKIDLLADKDSEFISEYNSKEYIQRGVSELNWILHNPWVYCKEDSDNNLLEESKKYYFSAIADNFQYHTYRLLQADNLIAILIIRQRGNTYTLPYIYLKDEYLKDVSNFLISFLIENKADSFTVFHKVLANHISGNKNPFYYIRKIEKDFAVSNELDDIRDSERHLQDGDGDYVFT